MEEESGMTMGFSASTSRRMDGVTISDEVMEAVCGVRACWGFGLGRVKSEMPLDTSGRGS